VEQVESFKFGGVNITNKLSWSKHTKTVEKRTQQSLFPLKRPKRFGMGFQFSLVASLPGMATALPLTARHYRG
jgi:hypothetical protein